MPRVRRAVALALAGMPVNSKLEVYTSASELGEVKLAREVSTGKAGTHTLATSASGMYASELEV